MTHVATARLSLLLSAAFASAFAVGCSRINASNGGNDAVAPGATSADTVVAHTFFPEHRGLPESVTSMLHVPRGFSVAVFATGLAGARMLAVSDDGTVYVTRPDAGEVTMLRADASGKAQPTPAAGRMPGVHGIAIHGDQMYLATTKEVSVADINADGSLGERRVIVASLPDGGQHSRRTIGIGPDGMLYISVGSDCNACAEPDGEHATMLRAPLTGDDREVFAKGLRNTIGFDWDPRSHELWGMDNGIDFAGDDDPPEELNRLVLGGDYGWPFRFGNNRVNRLFDRAKVSPAEFQKQTVAPFLTYAAHAAPIAMVFYGGSLFPGDYQGSAFVAMHGSWNRESPAGYRVVRIVFRDGQPQRFEDFLTGFLVERDKAYIGRPAGLAVAKDGSLLVSDDTNGVIYRVSYSGVHTS
jgi:glucose/arabinose dehydrogenase